MIFHYFHFYMVAPQDFSTLPAKSEFPYAAILEPVYIAGFFAVQFFWAISGFVFAHVYLQRRANFASFWSARFARLYPLHLATLVLVLVLQTVSLQLVGHWQIYDGNSLPNFLRHIALSSNWSTGDTELSFNGPIWSVSVEILAYVVFFLALPLLRRAPLAGLFSLAGVALALWLLEMAGPIVGTTVFECMSFFFLGSLVWLANRELTAPIAKFAIPALPLMAALLMRSFGFQDLFYLLFFTGVLATLVALEPFGHKIGGRLHLMGDISYAIYLVHVPLQMLVLLVADIAGAGRGFANSWLTLPLYLGATLLISWQVRLRFEKPLEDWLRPRTRRVLSLARPHHTSSVD